MISASSSEVFHSDRAGTPSRARQPTGVSSTATPSWLPSCATSAGEAYRPPKTQRYRLGAWSGSV